MKIETSITILTSSSRNNNPLPSLRDMLRSSRPSVLDVNNLLCSEEEPIMPCGNNKINNNSRASLKAKRKRATPTQLSVLNRVFNQTFFPSTELRVELGKQLGMNPRTVQIWFQNKRQSIRTAREQPIPRHHQRKKSNNNTPPVSPPPLSPSSASSFGQSSMMNSSYFHDHHHHSMTSSQQPPYYATFSGNSAPNTTTTTTFMTSPPISSSSLSSSSSSFSTETITLPPLRLPSPTSPSCWLSSSSTSPLSTTSSLPTPTSMDSIIYRD